MCIYLARILQRLQKLSDENCVGLCDHILIDRGTASALATCEVLVLEKRVGITERHFNSTLGFLDFMS